MNCELELKCSSSDCVKSESVNERD